MYFSPAGGHENLKVNMYAAMHQLTYNSVVASLILTKVTIQVTTITYTPNILLQNDHSTLENIDHYNFLCTC